MLVNARVFHALLRWHFVSPGHTGYTRLQLVHSLFTYILLTACYIVLFLGADQCTNEQVAVRCSILQRVASAVYIV